MNKPLILGLIALSLASCTKDEEMPAEKKSITNSNALSFSSYIAGGTRATVVDADAVKTSGFRVNAVYDGSLYILDDKAVFDGTDAYDTQSDTYYWPANLSSSNPIKFYAFNALTSTSPAFSGSTVADADKVSYTLAQKAEEQEDLVVATATADAKPAGGIQPLNFSHALSKINFSFKGADQNTKYDYIVRRIEVLAASGEAVCTIGSPLEWAAPASPTPAAGALFDAGTGNVNGGTLYEYSSGDVSVSGTAVMAMDNSLMLFPKVGTANKVAVRVYYKVVDNINNRVVANCGYVKTDASHNVEGDAAYDASTAIYGCKTVLLDADWEAGKAYRYVVTLPVSDFLGDASGDKIADDLSGGADADGDGDTDAAEFESASPIRFSVTVSDWVDVSDNEITIQ